MEFCWHCLVLIRTKDHITDGSTRLTQHLQRQKMIVCKKDSFWLYFGDSASCSDGVKCQVLIRKYISRLQKVPFSALITISVSHICGSCPLPGVIDRGATPNYPLPAMERGGKGSSDVICIWERRRGRREISWQTVANYLLLIAHPLPSGGEWPFSQKYHQRWR